MLTFDQVKDAQDRPTKDIEVPEWGGSVTCKTLSGADLDRLDAECYDAKGEMILDKYRAWFVALALFNNVTPEMVTTLQAKSGPVLHRLFNECRAFNKIVGMEQAAKN
jgi:hypothetical protein